MRRRNTARKIMVFWGHRRGDIVGQEGNKLEIEFEIGGRKRVIDSFVMPAG